MENRKILVDSTLLIDFLRKMNKEKSILWRLREKYNNLSISTISVFELYAGATSTKKLEDVEILLRWFEVIGFSDEIAELAGKLLVQMRKKNLLIEYRDLFIGATAVFSDMELATFNTKHFENIPGIKLFTEL